MPESTSIHVHPPVLEMDQVTKTYRRPNAPEVPALRGVSLSIRSSSLVLLEGPSGSGKTTLLALAGALLASSSGRISVSGVRVDQLRPNQRAAFRREWVGFVFQNATMIDALTVAENVEVALGAAGWRRPESHARALALLCRFGVDHRADALPLTLSGGERQRAAIARAFANDPALILADEPTGSLDSESGRTVMEALAAAARENGRAVLVVSHDPRIRPWADRILRMEDGGVFDAA